MTEYLVVVCHNCDEAHFVLGDYYEINHYGILTIYKENKTVASFKEWEVIREVDESDK